MFKALAVAALALVPTQVFADDFFTGFYAQIYGGGTAPGELTFLPAVPGSTYDSNLGSAWGATLGVDTSMTGLSLDIDFYGTNALLPDAPAMIRTASTSIDLRYTAEVADMLSLYGSIGVGALRINDLYYGTETFDATAAAYQVRAGAALNVSDNVALTLEGRWQDSFGPIPIGSGNSVDYGTAAVLVGVMVKTP